MSRQVYFGVGVAEQVRQIYEQRPYPIARKSASSYRRWRCVPLEWIQAIWRPKRPDLQRILVAGCGTGPEAFALARQFPRSEIVAVDFSSQSIAAAKELQKSVFKTPRIHFAVADLAARQFTKIFGCDFDFISCHGVLSYIPRAERVLANLAGSLKSDGALYLGVNGARHASVGGRIFLSAFGFDVAEFRDGSRLRDLLRLLDAICDNHGRAKISTKNAGYLAGDLFGPLIHNLAMSDWIEMARRAGLNFQGSYWPWRLLRSTMEGNYPRLLIPRSRPELCRLAEILCPAIFHRLLFTRQDVCNPPWDEYNAFLNWRPALTGLYTNRLPKRGRSWQALRAVTLKSSAADTVLDWRMPEWEVEILRRSNGGTSLREILRKIPIKVSPALLTEQLYVLYQLIVLRFCPPETNLPVRTGNARRIR